MGRYNKYYFGTDQDISMCIYKVTHKDTDKAYIGKTTLKARDRWAAHMISRKRYKTHFARALNKYGKDAFTFEVIDIAEDEKSLSHKEIFWISQHTTLSPNG